MATDIWPTIHAERRALIDDVSALTEQQWSTPSLCSEWTVHDVLAHLLALSRMTPPKFFVKFAGAGFDFNKFTGKEVVRQGAGGPAATLAAFSADQGRTSSPPGPKETWLGENLVHGEDIRRPLGIRRAYPVDEVARAIRFYAGSNAIIGGKRRVAGLTLKATDTDFSVGDGPIVEGPAMALLLAASGRGVALDELSGPGLDELRSRLATG